MAAASLGLVLGLVVGFLLALGGGKVYRAETLVFLGQPVHAERRRPIQSFATNPRTVGEIIRSESALRAAARASGHARLAAARQRHLDADRRAPARARTARRRSSRSP